MANNNVTKCEDMIRDIWTVLGCDKGEKQQGKKGCKLKFKVPARLTCADAKGEIESDNYLEIAVNMIRILAHSGIFEPVLEIADASAAKAGNQNLTLKYVNATAAFQGLLGMVYEIMDDGNVATNMDIRSAYTVTQTMLAIANIEAMLDAVLDALGVTLKHKVLTVPSAFNCVGKNPDGSIDQNDDASTEKLLPELLKERDNPVRTVELEPNADTIFEVLNEMKQLLQRSR